MDDAKSTNKKRLAFQIIIALMIPIIPFVVIGELPGEQWLQSTNENILLFGLTGAALLASDVLLPIPSSILGTLIGAKLGLFTGFITILAGLTLGSIVGYLVGRFFFKSTPNYLPTTPTLFSVFLSRPVPVLAEATSIISGASRLPFIDYFFATLFGNCLYSFFLAANGILIVSDNEYIYGIILALGIPSFAWLTWKVYPPIKKYFLNQSST